MDKDITNRISAALSSIENDHDVTMLLAIESGSRSWGFASTDSDYDVRFIYARCLDDYVRISPVRDVIELPIDDVLDINGWDVQKALGLLGKSNPPLLEWLNSPIIYTEHPAIAHFRQAASVLFDPVKTSHHYFSMALKNNSYLQHELVVRKKYLYVLRPLFCVEWIAAHGTMPPVRFDELVDFIKQTGVSADFEAALAKLLIDKAAGQEMDKQPHEIALDIFINDRLAHHKAAGFGAPTPSDYSLLDATFRQILRELTP